MLIPHEMLDPQVLEALIEEFVTRDGCELSDVPQKIREVKAQLNDKRAAISFDEESKSCNIITGIVL